MELRELEQERDYECWNCESPNEKDGPCEICGTDPHDGDGWRLECVKCETVAYGDRGRNVEHDMFMHRIEHCSEARFKVESL